MKINFYLRPSKVSEKSIQMFISFNGEREPFNTGFKVEEEKWDSSKQRVKLKFKEEAVRINLGLVDLEEKAIAFKDKYSPETPKLLKKLLLGVEVLEPKDFKEFFNFFESYMETSVPVKSIHNYRKCLIHLKQFSDLKYKIAWETLTMKFYKDFIKFMSTEYVNPRTEKLGILNSTIGKDIWTLKNVCEYARKSGIEIPFDVEGFSKPSVSDTRRHFITQEKLKKLQEFDFTNWELFTEFEKMKVLIETKVIPNVLKVRDIYTFSFYTGLAHKEIMKIKPEQIITGKDAAGNEIKVLEFSRTKTKQSNSIPISKNCIEIIEKYKGGKTVFPYFANSQYNRICKAMFKMAGFKELITITRWSGDKEIVETFEEWELLTSHTGRHSAATNILQKSGDLTLARDLLGHSSVKTTEIYAKNVKEEFNSKILNIINDAS